MNNKVVSIIIPIYNVSKYLDECIKSVLCQTYKYLEIILVNDGSTDHSLDICKKYKKMDNRIKIVDKKNGGLSDARNVGIKKSRGDYIFFLDGDDFIANDTIEIMIRDLEKNKAQISVCGYMLYYMKTKEEKRLENIKEDYIKVYSTEEALKIMLDMKKSFKWTATNKLYSREVIEDIEFPKSKLYEDLGTTYKAICKSNTIVYNSKPMYYYVQNPKSITKTYDFNERELHRIEMAENLYNDLKIITEDKFLLSLIEKTRCSQYIAVLNIMIRCNKKDEQLINKVKRLLKDNIAEIKKHLSKKEKVQYSILKNSYTLYRIMFKLINKV